MAKIHWSGGSSDLRLGCERERGTRHGSIEHRTWSASMFAERSASAPDHYCALCAKAARLALAAESAPKPSDVAWPKPRPISEAPHRQLVLVRVPGLTPAWTMGLFDRRWVDMCCCGAEIEPTHFLPLPPEVR